MPALPDQLPSSRSPSRHGAHGGASGRPPVKSLQQVAGGLGLAGVLLGIAILIAACAGFDAALYFSPAVLFFGMTDLVLTLIATRRLPRGDDSSVLASLFLAILAISGGLMELAVWMHWSILFNQPA
jgi:hypothetical protein